MCRYTLYSQAQSLIRIYDICEIYIPRKFVSTQYILSDKNLYNDSSALLSITEVRHYLKHFIFDNEAIKYHYLELQEKYSTLR